MLSRLVLVGMVAALGITVPTWPEIRGWMSAVHSWTACRLEEWDASASSDADPVVPPPLVHRPRPVFTPIEPDETASAVADALNRVSDGRDLRPGQALATRRPTGREMDHPAAGRERVESSGVPSLDSREGEWMAELRQAFERSDAQVGADEVPAAPRRSRMRLDPPLVCVFTASPMIAAPVRPVTAAPVETSPRPRRSWPKIDPAQAFAAVESEIAAVGIGSPGGSRGCFPVGPPRIGRRVRRSSRSTRLWPSPRAWPMS